MLGTESHPAGTSHSSLLFIFYFLRAVISNPCPNDLQSIYSLFPVALEEIEFSFFLCICASVCWRRNRPWPPSSNPWTSTCTRLISSACASYRLPPFPPRHPHRWMTGLLEPTRPNPLIPLHHGCPADWSSDRYFSFSFFFFSSFFDKIKPEF